MVPAHGLDAWVEGNGNIKGHYFGQSDLVDGGAVFGDREYYR